MNHRIVFFGSGSFGLPTLKALSLRADVNILAVVSQVAKPAGRERHPRPTVIAQWAKNYQLKTLTPETLAGGVIDRELSAAQADMFLVADYGLILPPRTLQIPPRGCLNIHASLLPKYRGASPVSAAILNNDTSTGVTLMLMDAGIDTGPILDQWPYQIPSDADRPDLESKLADLAAANVPEALDRWWRHKLFPQVQPGPAVYAPRLKVTDGLAVWDSAEEIARKIRAYRPWPGIWTNWRGQRLKILKAKAGPAGRVGLRPGIITTAKQSPGWAIVCRHGWLHPELVQLAGKQPISAESMPGSYPNFVGSSCD